MRRLRPALITLCAAVVLAGCGSGPSKINNAAIIGENSVSVDAVQDDVRWLVENVPFFEQFKENRRLDLVSRTVVDQWVRHELLRAAVSEEKLQADPAEVDELIARAGGRDEAAAAFQTVPRKVRQVAEDTVLLRTLVERAASRIAVSIVGASVTEEAPGSTAKDKALELGKKVAASPGQVAGLITEGGGQVVQETFSLGEMIAGDAVHLAISPLFTVPAGTVVVFQPDPQEGASWIVALVTDRTETESKEKPPRLDGLDPAAIGLIGAQLLRPYADEVDVRVSPRYGAWDRAGMTVAPGPEFANAYLFAAGTTAKQ